MKMVEEVVPGQCGLGLPHPAASIVQTVGRMPKGVPTMARMPAARACQFAAQ
jgi:hypothetical protein